MKRIFRNIKTVLIFLTLSLLFDLTYKNGKYHWIQRLRIEFMFAGILVCHFKVEILPTTLLLIDTYFLELVQHQRKKVKSPTYLDPGFANGSKTS